jgi:hypothetical protein
VRRTLVALAAIVAAPGAFGVPPPVAGASPNDLVTRPLVLAPGDIAARVAVELNLEGGRFAMPLSIAPDLWVGVTSHLTIGLIHSNESIEQIDPRASLCFRSSALSCDLVYRGSGLDVLWSWREGALAVAPRGRILVRDTDPWKPAITAGALVRWTQGRTAITSDPYLRLGLANRDLGNRAALVVPVSLGVQPTWCWLIALDTGWDGEFATWRDGWHIPLALTLVARATRHVDVRLSAGFPHLLGPQNTPKERVMSIIIEVRP